MAADGRDERTAPRLAGLLVLAWAVTWLANRSLLRITGPSMLPTLRPGQLVLTVPVLARRMIRPGRIVVARDPRQPHRTIVKRVQRADEGLVWLAGDNEHASTDSRAFGPVDVSAVHRVVVVALRARQRRLRSQGAGSIGGGLG